MEMANIYAFTKNLQCSRSLIPIKLEHNFDLLEELAVGGRQHYKIARLIGERERVANRNDQLAEAERQQVDERGALYAGGGQRQHDEQERNDYDRDAHLQLPLVQLAAALRRAALALHHGRYQQHVRDQQEQEWQQRVEY